MGEVTEAIGKCFEIRNQAWITGNIDRLLDEFCGKGLNDWAAGLRHNVARKREAARYRNSQLLRAHSKISVGQLEGTNEKAHAEIIEHVTWVYRDGLEYRTESRVIEHQQDWRRTKNGWCLVKALEAQEQVRGWDGLENKIRSFGEPGTGTDLYPDYLRCRSYDRVRAQRYADLWWNTANPAYLSFQDDCTNYISQCLHAGGLPMHRENRDRTKGWWYDLGANKKSVSWSYSWSVSNALYLYLTQSAGGSVVSDAKELNIGDVVFYDWDGSGHFRHTTVVTDFDSQGDPLVNAHTVSSFHRHYLYLDSAAWSPKTRYAFVHLPKEVC